MPTTIGLVTTGLLVLLAVVGLVLYVRQVRARRARRTSRTSRTSRTETPRRPTTGAPFEEDAAASHQAHRFQGPGS
ncbi:hypothetical protein [Oryzobacter terrae]|uniref:hypothetical protein n=1 Tax=Oryzobacter terrae TaxID=1620385 RepID=UPI0036723AE7